MASITSPLSPGSLDSIHALGRRGFAAEPYKRKPPAKTQAASGRHLTLGEVGEELGCTRENVRLIEKRALQKCLRWCERHNYQLSDLL